MRQFSYEKILLALGLLLFLASGYISYRQFQRTDQVAAVTVLFPPGEAVYEGVLPDFIQSEVDPWQLPPSQSTGPLWIYEVFTPPVIYYNPRERTFQVTPPRSDLPHETPFGLRLLSIERKPYPIQLVGYAGTSDNILGTFQVVATGEILLGRSGREFVPAGFRVESLRVLRRTTRVDGAGTDLIEEVAEAEIVDAAGRRTLLRTGETIYTADSVAMLIATVTRERFSAIAGDVIVIGRDQYHILSIETAPTPEVTVERHREEGEPAVRILRPTADLPSLEPDKSAPGRLPPQDF